MDRLIIKYKNEEVKRFEDTDKIEDLVKFLDAFKSDMKNVEFIPESYSKQIKESTVEDVAGKEWTIWSSSDFSESKDQIPLVKIIMDNNGELQAQAIGADSFDQESCKIAASSLKYSVGKPIKDRLLRVDKSLNHSDPFLSTELQRQSIISDRGAKRKSVADLVKTDPKTLSDEPLLKDETGIEIERQNIATDVSKIPDVNLITLANQILLTNRDDLKALANTREVTEDKLVNLFEEITGVNYYTEKITDIEQYKYLLDLLTKSTDIYKDTNESPTQNKYVQYLKDLTEDLIEKVLLRQDPDFYQK